MNFSIIESEFFIKINKIDKPQVRLILKEEEVIYLRNKIRDHVIDPTDIEKSNRRFMNFMPVNLTM